MLHPNRLKIVAKNMNETKISTLLIKGSQEASEITHHESPLPLMFLAELRNSNGLSLWKEQSL